MAQLSTAVEEVHLNNFPEEAGDISDHERIVRAAKAAGEQGSSLSFLVN